MKRILFFVAFIFINVASFGQILTPVKWSYASKQINDKETVLLLKATIEDSWHIYSQTVPKEGPEPTSFSFYPSKAYELNGKTNAPNPIIEYDPTFDMEVGYYENSVVFQQRVKLVDLSSTVKGTLTYMVCNDEQCLPPEEVTFNIPVN